MNCPLPFPLCFALLLACLPASAAEHYVAADGSSDNRGSMASPWDIASAWSGQQKVSPGDTIVMRGGVYRHPDRTWQSKGYELALEERTGNGEFCAYVVFRVERP